MKSILSSALLLLAISPLAQAHHDRDYYNTNNYQRGTVKARVIDATPVYKYQRVRRPQTYCEPIVVHQDSRRSRKKHAVILGGIVGGVVGHAVGDDRHKGLATAVGALVGGSLANKVSHAKGYSSRQYQTQQRCSATRRPAQKVRVLKGYDVTYRSKGKYYQTFMRDMPAKFIRIRR